MAMLLRHDNMVFEDRVMYVSGNAYFNCHFVRCTMIVREAASVMQECSFNGCIWHLDILIHDPEQVDGVINLLQTLRNSVPAEQGSSQQSSSPQSPSEPPAT